MLKRSIIKNGIAEWRYQDKNQQIMANSACEIFWGINRSNRSKLNKRGIFTIGD